eukprot:CAMPEP_0170093714 /NCGR_PEP_ID=MMETSP0019_2-20121128/26704_1 /TAXON_ID=98059 /ORGANISM="Dinobryon sp., Strain UTEXLB2267" /LENGTH=34 /DNA_ID= /DNA_START= /DNA_END= /DNA_ORIENTATION=
MSNILVLSGISFNNTNRRYFFDDSNMSSSLDNET